MPGQRNRLLTYALHQVAVGGEHEGEMIDNLFAEFGGEMALRDRHADRVGESLAKRAGRGLDARGDEVFRVSRSERADLAEALELVERQRLVAEQVQRSVDQHR